MINSIVYRVGEIIQCQYYFYFIEGFPKAFLKSVNVEKVEG